MSTSMRTLAILCLVAFTAACAKKPEPVAVQAPITTEPTYTGKYK